MPISKERSARADKVLLLLKQYSGKIVPAGFLEKHTGLSRMDIYLAVHDLRRRIPESSLVTVGKGAGTRGYCYTLAPVPVRTHHVQMGTEILHRLETLMDGTDTPFLRSLTADQRSTAEAMLNIATTAMGQYVRALNGA